MEQAKEILFWGVVASLAIYDSLLLFSISRPQLRFWPLPPRPSWRHELMRRVGVVGPLSIAAILVLGVLDWDTFAWRHWSRFAAGGLLFAAGGAFALWGFFGLGITASQGLGGPLLVRGAYRYSRNPQYIGTVGALIGYGIICASTLTLVSGVLWSSWYLLAPFAEEPWLREQLGAPFREYVFEGPALPVKQAIKLRVKVVPGSSRDGIAGWLGETLKVRVTAPAERGKANAAVEALIAAALGITKDCARVVAGRTSPRKVVEIDGLSEAEVRRRLEEADA